LEKKVDLVYEYLKNKKGNIMKRLGLDLGTKNIVLSCRDPERGVRYKREINGFYKIPNTNSFAKNMLINAGVPYIEKNGDFIALGSKAEEIAHAFNKTLRRPMSDGVLSRSEDDGIEIMATIVHSLIGELKEDTVLCYCIPANSINRDINVSFHSKVAQMIMNSYESKSGNKIKAHSINEAQALILSSTQDKTGVAISFGSGMNNIAYCLYGIPVYTFSWVGAGDWIDVESAKQFGYDPTKPEGNYKHTPTSIARIKEKLSLKSVPNDPVERAIYINYAIMIENVVDGIIDGFRKNEDKARISKPVPIILGGGTASPEGFVELFKDLFLKKNPPFEVGEIRMVEKPLLSVSEGCLMSAEMTE
jgi:hypothetical protein